MATWRRRDLERRSGQRSRRMGAVLRAEMLIPVLALIVAGVALWQAMAAQSRADLLAHDLSLASGQLHSLAGYAAPAPPPSGASPATGDGLNPPLPPLVPAAPAPGASGTSPSGSNP